MLLPGLNKLLVSEASDLSHDPFHATQRRSQAALSGVKRARPAPLWEWSQRVDSRGRRRVWLVTSVTARVVA